MQQRALVFTPPQSHENFPSVFMAGSLSIVALGRWAAQLWFDYGIYLFGSNDYIIASNDNRISDGPEEAA